jgi:hypothetical protein
MFSAGRSTGTSSVLMISWKWSSHLEPSGKHVGEVRLLWCTINAYSWIFFFFFRVHAKTFNQFKSPPIQVCDHFIHSLYSSPSFRRININLLSLWICNNSFTGWLCTHLHADIFKVCLPRWFNSIHGMIKILTSIHCGLMSNYV